MNNVSTIIASLGVLTAFVSGLYAALKSANQKVLRDTNNDYKERNSQLEAELVILKKQVEQLRADIIEIRRQKELPFQNLTDMLVKQHTEQSDSISALAVEIGSLAKEIAKQTKANQ